MDNQQREVLEFLILVGPLVAVLWYIISREKWKEKHWHLTGEENDATSLGPEIYGKMSGDYKAPKQPWEK